MTWVEETLDAFRVGSGVPVKTQLEILEALGHLGASVKQHLIDATKASLFPVRRRAIEMLLPHLSDDELFAMDHIFEDRSKEPIRAYLQALTDRGPGRTRTWLSARSNFPEKALAALSFIDESLFSDGVADAI